MNGTVRYGAIGSALGTVGVWVCRNDDVPAEMVRLLAGHWLDEGERHTAARFLFDRDRAQYLAAHTLVRRVLCLELGVPEAELAFARTDRGRPFLSADPLAGGGVRRPDFNLSHTRGLNAVALGYGRRVGIDAECLDRGATNRLGLLAGAFSEREQRWLASLDTARRPRGLLRLWTLKEAYTKARGLGMSLPFDSFDFVLSAERGVLEFRPPDGDTSANWWFVELEPAPQSLVALAIEVNAAPVRRVVLRHGFPWRRSDPLVITLPQSQVAGEEHY